MQSYECLISFAFFLFSLSNSGLLDNHQQQKKFPVVQDIFAITKSGLNDLTIIGITMCNNHLQGKSFGLNDQYSFKKNDEDCCLKMQSLYRPVLTFLSVAWNGLPEIKGHGTEELCSEMSFFLWCN